MGGAEGAHGGRWLPCGALPGAVPAHGKPLSATRTHTHTHTHSSRSVCQGVWGYVCACLPWAAPAQSALLCANGLVGNLCVYGNTGAAVPLSCASCAVIGLIELTASPPTPLGSRLCVAVHERSHSPHPWHSTPGPAHPHVDLPRARGRGQAPWPHLPPASLSHARMAAC